MTTNKFERLGTIQEWADELGDDSQDSDILEKYSMELKAARKALGVTGYRDDEEAENLFAISGAVNNELALDQLPDGSGCSGGCC